MRWQRVSIYKNVCSTVQYSTYIEGNHIKISRFLNEITNKRCTAAYNLKGFLMCKKPGTRYMT